MKIVIERFGPIERFEYDLTKNLIVTYGDNNIGKSYAMQVVYLLLKTLKQVSSRPVNVHLNCYNRLIRYFVELNEDKMAASDDSIESLVQDNSIELFENSILQDLIDSFRNTFGNFDSIVKKEPTIRMLKGNCYCNINIKDEKIQCSGIPFTLKWNWEITDPQYGTLLLEEQISNCTHTLYDYFLEDIGNTYFLPASRSGIYSGMNAFGGIVAELSKSRSMVTKKISLPSIPEPISDYFIMLSNIRTPSDHAFNKYSTRIEEDILKGMVTFDTANNTLLYHPDKGKESFEMTEVSSMVSEVSPIVAFLKFVMEVDKVNSSKVPVLFIEEPEAHLHPNNQIMLIEILADLASEGVKIMISSHSNYIFNKLNNLVLSKKLEYSIYEPIYLQQQKNGSISNRMAIDEFGAEDENFLDVSEKLYEEREQIIAMLNEEEKLNDF